MALNLPVTFKWKRRFSFAVIVFSNFLSGIEYGLYFAFFLQLESVSVF